MHCLTRLSAVVVIVSGSLCNLTAANEPSVIIADKGHSNYTIVIASHASDSEKHGATAKLIRKRGKGHGWATILWDMRKFAKWFDEHLEPPAAN